MEPKEQIALERAYDHFLVDLKYYRAGYLTAPNVSGVIAKLLEPVRSAWRVVGITEAALAAFIDANFAKPEIKITRAHLIDRKDTADLLLETNDLTFEQFTEGVIGERDHCVLALSSENKSISTNETIINFDNLGDDPLFQRKGYSWRYQENEIEFLKILAKSSA
jgi:hypothetical protein